MFQTDCSIALLALARIPDPMLAPILVALGAVPGALSRYYLTMQIARWLGTAFPYGTFLINLTGAGLIGFLTIAIDRQAAAANWQLLLIVGFLGSYTTFSTYALDTSNLWRAGRQRRALFYGLGSPVLGFFCVELGILLAKRILPGYE